MFSVGKSTFNEYCIFINDNKRTNDSEVHYLLTISKSRALNHFIYTLFTGRTPVFANEKKEEVLKFSKNLAMFCAFRKDFCLRVFNKEINEYDARIFAIIVTPEYKYPKSNTKTSFIN